MCRATIQPRHRRPRGMTLFEVSIVVIVLGILMSLTVPSFTRVTEQNHLDASVQYLRSVWSAQRVYWLEHRTFADSMTSLDALGLIDAKLAIGNDGYFTYQLSNVADDTFTVTATRNGSDVWTGTLTITQDGEVTGFVHHGGTVLTPPDF